MSRTGFYAALLVAFFVPDLALAYVGPGAGLTALGTVIAVVAAIFLALVGFVWYPVKRMLRGRKSVSATDDASSKPQSS